MPGPSTCIPVWLTMICVSGNVSRKVDKLSPLPVIELQVETETAAGQFLESRDANRMSSAHLRLGQIGLGRIGVKIHRLPDATEIRVRHMVVKQIPDVGPARST